MGLCALAAGPVCIPPCTCAQASADDFKVQALKFYGYQTLEDGVPGCQEPSDQRRQMHDWYPRVHTAHTGQPFTEGRQTWVEKKTDFH